MVKKFLSTILALSCCLGCSAATLAQEAPGNIPIAAPRYVSNNSVASVLSVSGTNGTMLSSINGKAGTTKIVITHVLQKKSGTQYSDISSTKHSRTYRSDSEDMSDDVALERGQTYRVKTTAKITGSGGTDTVTKYSKAVTCR